MQTSAFQMWSHDYLRVEGELTERYLLHKSVLLLMLGLFNSHYWIGMLKYILKSLMANMICDDRGSCIKIGKACEIWKGFLCLDKLWMEYQKSIASRSSS